RVLRRESRDDGRAERAKRVEGLQVRLDPGAAAAVAAGDRECYRNGCHGFAPVRRERSACRGQSNRPRPLGGRGRAVPGLRVSAARDPVLGRRALVARQPRLERSEEHTSELQSRENLVCRLLLEKKNYKKAI